MTNQRTSDQPRRHVPSADLTIYQAAEHKPRLLELIRDGGEVELDLCSVQAIDAAGLQLLILLKREAAARGVALRFVGHSEPVRAAIEFCNLAATLGDPLLIPAGARA